MSYSQLLSSMMNAIVSGDTSSAPAFLRDKKDFPPERQLAVYSEGYRLRLIGALRSTYPALLYYLGGEAFARFAHGFITASPSRLFNLDKYTIGFGPYVADASKDAFTRELAALENAVHDVYQGEETPAVAPDWAQSQSPETLSAMPLCLRAASRLLAFSHPVDAWFSAFRDEQKPGKPQEEPTWLLVLRHRHQLKRLPLDEAEYALLALFAEGRTLAEALDSAAMVPYITDGDFAGKLQGWFSRWLTEGVLRQP